MTPHNKHINSKTRITTEKIIKGKKKLLEVSRLPNILFAFGTEEDIKTFVYDNVNLP